MAKNYYVSEYFHEPMCPLGYGNRMRVSRGDAKFLCKTHGIKVEFRDEMKTRLRREGESRLTRGPWNDLRKR